jgi:DNA-binding HxlR family transcriptional regulator
MGRIDIEDSLNVHNYTKYSNYMSSHSAPELCERFHKASELIGARWTGAIIFVMLKQQPCRFVTLREAIPDITDRMLSDRLRELEREAIVVRTVLPQTPVRVEYALTRKGRGLARAIEAITDWAHRWIPLEPTRRERRGRDHRRAV